MKFIIKYLYLKFFENTVNQHTRASFHEGWGQRWMGMITETLAAILIGGCALFGVIAKDVYDPLLAALVGLSLTYAL